MQRNLSLAMIAVALLPWATSSRADSMLTFSATGSGGLGATAVFSYVTSTQTLTVTLSNTGTTLSDPASLLTAIMFDYNGGGIPSSPTITPVSAHVASGSTAYVDDGTGHWAVYNGWAGAGVSTGDVSSEWAYVNTSGGLTGVSQHVGISSTGLNDFGSGDLFDPTHNLAGPASPDGAQFGLGPAGSVIAGNSDGNLGNTNNNPIVTNSVVFTFTTSSFDANLVGNVRFQYGTSLGEGHLTPGPGTPPPSAVPLPTTAWAGIAILAGLAVRRFAFKRPPVAA